MKAATVLFAALLAIAAAVFYPFLSPFFSSLPAPPPSPHRPIHSTCRPHVTRQPIPSTPLPAVLSSPHQLALSVQHSLTPLLFRGDSLSLFHWRGARSWSAEYFSRAAERKEGPEEFLIKRSKSRQVKFANLRTERPYVRMAKDGAEGEEEERASSTKQQQQSGDQHSWPQMEAFRMPYTAHNVSVRSFFDEIGADSPESFVYFADGLSILGPLARDILPIAPLCPHADLSLCDMSLWIGRGGVTAAPHYDASQNLFVQVKGRKKFTIAHPRAARCGLGLYPSLHPFYRQAQRDLMGEEEDLDAREVFIPAATAEENQKEGCCTLELFESILEEGDVLYMPPHWFHRVTSLSSPSFSINSWWHGQTGEGAAREQLEKVVKQPLPFEQEWSRRQQMAAATVFIQQVYAAIEQRIQVEEKREAGDSSSPSASASAPFLAKELLVTRFYPMFDQIIDAGWCASRRKFAASASATGDKLQQKRAAASEGKTELYACVDLSAREWNELLPVKARFPAASFSSPSSSSSAAAAVPSVPLVLDRLRLHFLPYVSRIIRLYESDGVDVEWMRLHVHNYVEEILFYSVDGDVEELYPYLACCVAGLAQ